MATEAPAKKPTYTRQEVSTHNTREDCWIIIYNKVYDVTKFLPEHPGGGRILGVAGRDATNLFEKDYHTNGGAGRERHKWEIGDLVEE